jgi:DNA-binding MarR family transcriptional regulator
MVDRDVHVIGRLTNNLEEAGLIERIHNTPKSRLLNLELTKKGLTMIKINPYSKTLNAILSTLSKEDYAQLESSLYIISTKLKECTPGSSRTGAALKLIRDSDCS